MNNRDLHTLAVRVETSFELIEAIPEDCIAVSESGLRSADDLARLRAAGFDAFLIGESLMREADPGAGLRRLLGGMRRERRRESRPIVRVKICGVTNWADARLAVDLGADALGFNFYPPSPRSVSPAAAWEIIRRLAADGERRSACS